MYRSSTSSTGLVLRRLTPLALLCLLLSLAVGCGGHKSTAHKVPTPPPPPAASAKKTKPSTPDRELAPLVTSRGVHVDPKSPVIWSQTGYASWYGPNYHNKKAANGEIYDQNELTAAHNSLPFNSIVRVVNLKNNQSTVVRITDRGPFVSDRIIDLSMASAKAIDIYTHGTAPVRLEVLSAPHSIETGGRWCVQMGDFKKQETALRLKQQLIDHYPGAQVLSFAGPTGYWVRIRIAQDDKEKARRIYERTKVEEGDVFLVRLD